MELAAPGEAVAGWNLHVDDDVGEGGQGAAGNWRGAIQAVLRSQELSKGGEVADWLILAMSHGQLGERGAGRPWFDKARQWMEQYKPTDDGLRRLRAEAAALLGIKDQPPPKDGPEPPEKK